MMGQVPGLLFDFRALFPKRRGYTFKNCLPGRPVMQIYRREIGSSVKWFSFRSKKNVEWPASVAGNCLHSIHVNMIQVGSFLSVNLDIYKMPVHEDGSVRILKTLPFHHMTPMTCGVPNAHEHGFIFFPGFLNGFISPRIPVYRV